MLGFFRLQEAGARRGRLEEHDTGGLGRDPRYLDVSLHGMHGMRRKSRCSALSLADIVGLRLGRDDRDSGQWSAILTVFDH